MKWNNNNVDLDRGMQMKSRCKEGEVAQVESIKEKIKNKVERKHKRIADWADKNKVRCVAGAQVTLKGWSRDVF